MKEMDAYTGAGVSKDALKFDGASSHVIEYGPGAAAHCACGWSIRLAPTSDMTGSTLRVQRAADAHLAAMEWKGGRSA